MNKHISRIDWALLFFCIFITTRFDYGQIPDDAVLRNAGLAEYRAGHFERAELLLRNALEAAERSRNDYAAATVQTYLGDVYQNEDRLLDAERAYANALSIFRRIPGKSYETAIVLRNLGTVYSLDRRDSEAVKVLHEASKLVKRTTPNEEALAAQLLNSLAMVYFRQGKTGKTETLLVQATTLGAKGGASDLENAQILNNLGMVYERQHKFGKAEVSFKQSLEITEQQLGTSHPDLTFTLGNIGGLYTEMRRYGEATEVYQRSLSILEQTTPPLDARIVRTLDSLGKAYLRGGDTTEAEIALARALDIARRSPVCRRDLPTILDTYADVLKNQGKSEEAARFHREARQTRTSMGLTVRAPNR